MSAVGLDPVKVAFDAGWLAAMDFLNPAPVAGAAFDATAWTRALDVQRARQDARERFGRLDAAEKAGPVAYARERAAQHLIPVDPRGPQASWATAVAQAEGVRHAVAV